MRFVARMGKLTAFVVVAGVYLCSALLAGLWVGVAGRVAAWVLGS